MKSGPSIVPAAYGLARDRAILVPLLIASSTSPGCLENRRSSVARQLAAVYAFNERKTTFAILRCQLCPATLYRGKLEYSHASVFKYLGFGVGHHLLKNQTQGTVILSPKRGRESYDRDLVPVDKADNQLRDITREVCLLWGNILMLFK